MAKTKDLNIKQAILIRICDCKHDFQDERYGKQKRVFNTCSNGKGARCTVCNKVISI